MYIIENENTGERLNIIFDTCDEASDYSQNYGPEWNVVEL